MNSKECLEIIFEKLYLILPKNIREDLVKPIKQDLEQKEKLEEENIKLKKVIESLKDNIYFRFNDDCTYICLQRDEYDECDYTIIHPNEEQYKLLKEVFLNGK